MIHRFKEELRTEYDAYLVAINRQLNKDNPYKPLSPPSLSSVNGKLDEGKVNNGVAETHSQGTYIPPVANVDKETIKQLQLKSSNSVYIRKESVKLLMDTIKRHATPNVNSADFLLNAFNFYYWLLLRDSHPNITRVRDDDIEKEMTSIIETMLQKLQSLVETSLSSTDHKEHILTSTKQQTTAKDDEIVVDGDGDELIFEGVDDGDDNNNGDNDADDDDEEELKKAEYHRKKEKQMAQTNFWLLKDLLEKIMLLIRLNK